MEWFEKEYKKRFEDESTLDGVENDALWDQISLSIPQKGPSKKLPIRLWTTLVLILLGSTFLWTLLQYDNANNERSLSKSIPSINSQQNQEQKVNSDKTISSIAQAKNVKENDILASQENQLNLNYEELNSPDDLAQNSQDLSTISKIKIASTSSSSSSSSDKTNGVNESVEKQTSTNNLKNSNESLKNTLKLESTSQVKSFQHQNQSESQIQESNSQLISEETIQVEAKNTDKEDKGLLSESFSKTIEPKTVSNETKVRKLIELDMIDLLKIGGGDQNKLIEMPLISPVKIIVERNNPFAINVQTSVNFFDLKYSDDQNTELFVSDANASLGAMQLGNSLAINLEYELNRSWSISAGFELNNYENQLNQELTSDTMVVDGMEIIREAKNIRTIRQHNKLSTFSIPLSIAYEKHISDRWSIGTSIGASYSLVRSQSGRLLSRDNEILDYSDNENSQFKNFLSFRINPFLKYKISDNVSFNFNAGVSMQNHGQSDILELTQKSKIYSLGIGLQYKM